MKPIMQPARFVLLAILGVALTPTSALAAPTINPPTTESIADSRPLFTWTTPADEDLDTIEVSSSSATTPDGDFYDENYVTSGVPDEGATSWQPTSRIHAGTYWYNADWHTTDWLTTGTTTPASFVIPPRVRIAAVFIRQYNWSSDTMTVAYNTNTRRVHITCLVFHGQRRIARQVTTDTYVNILQRDSSTCEVNVSRAYAGKRLRLVGEIRAGGILRRMTRYVTGIRS